MGAANKVSEVNTFRRANLVTGSATRAFVVINSCKIVDYLYSALGTLLSAESAAYTAILANLANVSALVVAAALYNYTLGVVDKMNYSVGTLLCAKTASYTLPRIDLRNILLGINADSISWTNVHTIAVAKARESTFTVAGIEEIRAGASHRSGVNVLSLFGMTRAVTSNVSNTLNNVTCLNSHYFGNILCHTVTAGNT